MRGSSPLRKERGSCMVWGENRFLPESAISRQDMMVMLVRAMDAMDRALGAAQPDALSRFTDGALVSEYARDCVARLIQAELVNGANGKINPFGLATRAEVAVLLARIF